MNAALPILRERNSKQKTETYIDGIWYTISRNRMTYSAEGKRTSLENLAGQVTTTAWDGWSVTYNGENRPVLWECVSTNSSTHNSSTPTLISMSYDRMGRRVTKNNQRYVYDGYLQIANFELSTSNIRWWERYFAGTGGLLMRYIYLTMLISCTALGCSVSRQICKKENPPPQIRKVCIGADGCIPDDCVQLKTLPYREQWLKCFGGKANYNTELALSKKLIICPYGPVSRGMDHDLESYSARVRVPLDSNRQRVMWQVETVYEKTNDTAVVLLLTVENMQDWKHRFVRVEEIPSGMYAHIVNRKLEEKESIVVFNSIGIFIKSSGDEKFRGYLFEQIQTIDNGIK